MVAYMHEITKPRKKLSRTLQLGNFAPQAPKAADRPVLARAQRVLHD